MRCHRTCREPALLRCGQRAMPLADLVPTQLPVSAPDDITTSSPQHLALCFNRVRAVALQARNQCEGCRLQAGHCLPGALLHAHRLHSLPAPHPADGRERHLQGQPAPDVHPHFDGIALGAVLKAACGGMADERITGDSLKCAGHLLTTVCCCLCRSIKHQGLHGCSYAG